MLTFHAYFSSNIIDFTDHEMCYLKDLSATIVLCETYIRKQIDFIYLP